MVAPPVAPRVAGRPVVAPPPPGPVVARGHAAAAGGRAEGRCHAATALLVLGRPGACVPAAAPLVVLDRGCAALVEPGCRLGMAWRFLLLVKTMFVLRTGDDGA